MQSGASKVTQSSGSNAAFNKLVRFDIISPSRLSQQCLQFSVTTRYVSEHVSVYCCVHLCISQWKSFYILLLYTYTLHMECKMSIKTMSTMEYGTRM